MAENLYEAMFVVDASKGGAEFAACVRHIAGLVTRHEARIERVEKWEERKFAYPIKGCKRGIYVLVFFRADGSAIAEMRRMINLSEEVLRVLILKAQRLSEVNGQLYSAEGVEIAATTAPPAAAQPPAPEGAQEAPEAPEGGPDQSEQ